MLCWCWEGRGGGGRANGRVEGQSSEGGLMGLVWGLGAMWGQVSARGPWGAVEVLKGGLPRAWGRGTFGSRPLSSICFAGKPVWSAPLPSLPHSLPQGWGERRLWLGFSSWAGPRQDHGWKHGAGGWLPRGAFLGQACVCGSVWEHSVRRRARV